MTPGHGMLPTPPMGWNSWDCFGTGVTEAEVLANADYMAGNLRHLGYEYVVVDIRWYTPGRTYAELGSPFAACEVHLDEYGRPMPDLERFPSAVNGRGFGPLAESVHDMGLKFGVHILRGIPREAVRRELPIKGSRYRAHQVADREHACWWCPDNFGLLHPHEGSEAYYRSLVSLFQEWGVDYVKADDMTFPFFRPEIESFSRAVGQCGQPMVFSLSPGGHAGVGLSVEHASVVAERSQLWRVTGDVWDQWEDVVRAFDSLAVWSPFSRAGAWPDGDILPIGRLMGPGSDEWRQTRLLLGEQRVLLTLWSIARSPLMIGGDLTTSAEESLALLANEAIVGLLWCSEDGHELFREGGVIAWKASVVDGSGSYLAVFNVSDTPADVSIPWKDCGVDRPSVVQDLWSGRESEIDAATLQGTIPAHDVVCVRVA